MLRALSGRPATWLLCGICVLPGLSAISSPARAQDRQQAALADRAPSQVSAQHDNRARPHGPVGEPGPSGPLDRAMDRHARGDARTALALYEDVLRREPASRVALLNRGVVLSTHLSEPGRAISDFDRVLELAPDSVDALVFRGDAHMRLAAYHQALADFDRAVALAPTSAQVRVLRGLARAMLGDVTRASIDYGRALALDGRNVDALVNRAAILVASGDADGGLRDLDAALAIEPRNALALYNRGYIHFSRHRHEAAIRDYSAAIHLDPRFGWAYLNRCLTRAIAGRDLGEALADCDRARALLPDAQQVRTLAPQIARLVRTPATN
jgi:tetratricopeptide (TPR) repeat protein